MAALEQHAAVLSGAIGDLANALRRTGGVYTVRYQKTVRTREFASLAAGVASHLRHEHVFASVVRRAILLVVPADELAQLEV